MHNKTNKGQDITDEHIEQWGREAEAGLDVDKLNQTVRRGRARPAMGSAAAAALPVRLDPKLRASVVERAERAGVAQGEVIRRALRAYLGLAS